MLPGPSAILRVRPETLTANRMSTANPTLTDELFRAEIREARTMSAEDRLLTALRLSDFACSVAAEGIRQQFPDADQEQVRAILEERLALARRLEGRPHD